MEIVIEAIIYFGIYTLSIIVAKTIIKKNGDKNNDTNNTNANINSVKGIPTADDALFLSRSVPIENRENWRTILNDINWAIEHGNTKVIISSSERNEISDQDLKYYLEETLNYRVYINDFGVTICWDEKSIGNARIDNEV